MGKEVAKVVSKFVVMQRIDRLLKRLSDRERQGVLAWLGAEYGVASLNPAPAANPAGPAIAPDANGCRALPY